MSAPIIRNPTPDNSPNSIITPQPSDVEHILSSYIPQNFDNACKASKLWQKYVNCDPEKKDENKLSYDAQYVGWIVVSLALLLIALLLGILASLTPTTIRSIIHFVSIFIFAAGVITGIVASVRDHERDNMRFDVDCGFIDDPNPYCVSRKDEKSLNSINCINVHFFPIPTEHLHTLKLLRYVLSNDNISSTITLPDLRQAYNNYTTLLSFLWANHTTLSANLVEKYYKELQQRYTVLDKEVTTACHSLNEAEEIRTEFSRQQQNIIQEMRDNEALSVMPLSEVQENSTL